MPRDKADICDLRALEQEITRSNIEAVAADQAPIDDLQRPEVRALMESTATLCDALRDRDNLQDENAFLRQQLAAAHDKNARLEATLSEALSQRDYFRTAFEGVREAIEAIGRIGERGLSIVRQAYPERHRQQRAAAELPVDDPLPAIVTDRSKVHVLRGSPQRRA